MKKKFIKRKFVLSVVSIILMLIFITGCGNTTAVNHTTSPGKNTADTKTVIATTYAVYDWAKNIIKDTDAIDLKYLVDSSVDLHSYKPSAEDIITYKSADLILCIGGESEEWLTELDMDDNKICSLMDVVDKKEEELIDGMQGDEDASAGSQDKEGQKEDECDYDEHIWLSVKNAEKCAKEICDRLSLLNPENSSAYKENCEVYLVRLENLDYEYQTATDNAFYKTLLFGDRFPFRYLADDYGLDYYAAFSGCSAESEASFETIAFLAEKIDELNLKAVCVIGSDHKIADSIINTTKSKDQTIVEFNSMQSILNKEADNVSYMNIMEDNLSALKTALAK